MVVFLLLASLAIFSAVLCVALRDRMAGLTCVMFCLYHTLFLILPALFQIAAGQYPFYGLRYPGAIELDGAVQVFVFAVAFSLGYLNKLHRNSERKVFKLGVPKISFSLDKKRLWVVVSLCALFEVGIIGIFGVKSFVVSRADFGSQSFGDASFIRILLVSTARSVSALFLIIILYSKNKIPKVPFYFWLCVGGAGFFVLNFPLALPRFILFSYVILFIHLFMYPSFKVKAVIILAFVVGITTLFPVTSRLSRGDGQLKLPDPMEYLSTSGDFDGFQSILNIQLYVNVHGHTNGHQLLGAAFVLVPRAIWPSKALPTGQIAAAAVGYKFTNISSPLVSEIFIDFGYVGIVILGYLIGVGVRRIDFISLYSRWQGNVPIFVLTGAITAQLIILGRGALIGVLAGVLIQWALYYFGFKYTYHRVRQK